MLVLKDADDRDPPHSIAHWISDPRTPDETERLDGAQFRFRHGKKNHRWAVFERSALEQRTHHFAPVTRDMSELLEAFGRLGVRGNDVES